MATADAVYGIVAALGLVAVTEVLVGQQAWLRLLGGVAMVYLGVEAARTRPAAAKEAGVGGMGLARSYAATFGLTLMNPSTILSFVALFAGLGLGAGEREAAAPVALVAGVFLGSALWWLLVTGGIAYARSRVSLRVQRVISVGAGLALVVFGVLAIGSVWA